jgi:hypothetical protein
MEELPQLWKESNIVPIYRKGDKKDCSNYCGISLLSTTLKIVPNVLLRSLTPYAEEITEDHQCGFSCNRSTTHHIFCICQMLEKNWECNEAVPQLFTEFKKAYDSVTGKVLYNILIQIGIRMKLVRLIKMCLNEIYGRVWEGTSV